MTGSKPSSPPSSIPAFGTKLPGVAYRERPGGYLILLNDVGDVAVVREPEGWFLPGGGQNGSETPEEAATREAYEECAFRIAIERSIGMADQFVFSAAEGAHLHKRCSFFTGRLSEHDERAVPEFPVVWMTPERAARELSHESQRWAVSRTFRL